MHPIPNAALDERLGFLGMTGSGKTYGASTCVERILSQHGRVVIPDPLGVWYGLRLKSDGKTRSGYDVVIFGGPHADMPITPQSGALIGETVATMRESAILDLSQFETAASERSFMLAFLESLYRKANGLPVHLIFDEADLWAPERILDKEGNATKLHAIMQTVVRRGRIKGLTSWLISQRPAALSKNVLSQVDGLIAFRLTSSQDRKALGLWIEGQADREQGKAILDRLPTKGQGEAVIWLPQHGVLRDTTFPPKATFDSSRAPKRGETVTKRTLPPIDLETLKTRLATVEEQAKANDPKALRAEIARLASELHKAQSRTTPPTSPEDIHAAELRGAERVLAYANEHMTKQYEARKILHSQLAQLVEGAGQAIKLTPPKLLLPATPPTRVPKPIPREQKLIASQKRILATNVTLPKAERLILTALAQYPEGRTKTQVAILSGYAVNGGGFNNALGSLRKAERIRDTVAGTHLQITDAGREALGHYEPLPFGHELLQHWLGQLPKAERATLEYLASIHPKTATKEDTARHAGYEPHGGGFNNALGRLRKLELIEGRGDLKASDHLFG